MPRVRFSTPPLGLELDYCSQGIRHIQFRGRGSNRRKSHGEAPKPKWLDRLILQLNKYFNGINVDFKNIPILLDSLTPLQKEILKLVRKISYGATKSYGEIALALGHPKCARAVGRACHVNPLPILIPCHRVIRADGKLGGYSQGLEMKKKLLELEGIDFGKFKR